MGKKKLHIFNGDSSYELFRLNGEVKGSCVVWRELLCDGKCTYEVGSKKFWDTRAYFFENELMVDFEEYSAKTMAEFEKMDVHKFHEVILWFEYDLFCQINCLALISYLHQQSYEGLISILNILSFQEKPYTGLGELNPDYYKQIYDNRKRIGSDTVEVADLFWFEYCSTNHSGLSDLASLLKFPYLEETTKILLERHNKKNGISYYERILLESISPEGTKIKKVYRNIFSRIRKEGYGDVQISRALDALATYYDKDEGTFYLNKKGQKLLKGSINHAGYLYPSFIGGCPI